MNEEKKESAEQAGNSDDLIKTGPSANLDGGKPEQGAGMPDSKEEGPDYQRQYEEASKKITEQGDELGEFRTFFKNVSPLLDKLNDQPELIQAIIDGKVDSNMAKAAIEGKINLEEAKEVTEAHKEVKKELGNKEYEKASPEDIERMVSEKVEKLVSEKVAETKTTLQKNIDENEALRNFENNIKEFISNTPDFKDYADEVHKYLDAHKEIDDIEIAYKVVKGEALEKKFKESESANAGEAAKELAANAGGGASQGATFVEGQDIVDKLIAGRSNPNYL